MQDLNQASNNKDAVRVKDVLCNQKVLFSEKFDFEQHIKAHEKIFAHLLQFMFLSSDFSWGCLPRHLDFNR